MDRRDFVIWSSLAGISVLRQRAPTLRMALLTPAGAPRAAELGIRMGVEEAERGALLFGGQVRIASFAGDARQSATVATLKELIRRDGATAVFGGVAADECAALADMAEREGVLYCNVASPDDALRGNECRATTFHVAPSAAMYRDALTSAAVAAESEARSVAWDASLERFGADTLNRRFETRYGRVMTDESWTGWLAVKMLWESALRARTAEPGAVGALLTRDVTRFDGHKGRALSFRSWDHQLRQPMYVVTGSSGTTRTIEVPVASDTSATSTDVLDRLGVSATRTTCRWAR